MNIHELHTDHDADFDKERLLDDAFYDEFESYQEGSSLYVQWPGYINLLHTIAKQDERLAALIVAVDGPTCLLDEEERSAQFGEILAELDKVE